MAISEVSAQRVVQGGPASTTVLFTFPTTPVEGNLLVACWSYRLSTTTISATPSGWTNIEVRQGNINTVISYKVAGASESTTPTWTLNASVKSAGTATSWNSTTGWTSPFDKSATNSGATGTTGLTTGTTATTAGSGEILVIGNHSCDTNATFSGHAGTNVTATELSENSSTGGSGTTRNTTSMSTGINSSNAAVTITATLSASNNWAAAIAAFKEDVAASFSPSWARGSNALIWGKQ